MIFFAIFTTSLVLTQFLHLALAAALLWAPFNALLCFNAAKRRGLSGRPYAVAGAAYSILLALPGLYLLLCLRGNAIHRSQVIAAYVLCGLGFLVLMGSSYGLFLVTGTEFYAYEAWVSSIYGYFCLAMLLLAVIASAELYAFLKNMHPLYRRPQEGQRYLLNRAQLSPFLYVCLGDIGFVMLLVRT